MSECVDPIVGKILAGWRYDISGLAPEMREDYEDHFDGCAHCRYRQRLHRNIDLALIGLASVSAAVFLMNNVTQVGTKVGTIGHPLPGVATATPSQIKAERANPTSAASSSQKACRGLRWRITPKAMRKTAAETDARPIRARSILR